MYESSGQFDFYHGDRPPVLSGGQGASRFQQLFESRNWRPHCIHTAHRSHGHRVPSTPWPHLEGTAHAHLAAFRQRSTLFHARPSCSEGQPSRDLQGGRRRHWILETWGRISGRALPWFESLTDSGWQFGGFEFVGELFSGAFSLLVEVEEGEDGEHDGEDDDASRHSRHRQNQVEVRVVSHPKVTPLRVIRTQDIKTRINQFLPTIKNNQFQLNDKIFGYFSSFKFWISAKTWSTNA